MGNAHHTCAGVIGGDFPQSLCQALITFHEKRNKCAHHASKSLFLLRDLDPPLPLLTLELELGVYRDKSCFTKIKSVSRRTDREFNSGFVRILTWQIEIKQSHLNTQQIIASQGLLTWGFNVVTWASIIYIIFRTWSRWLFSVSVSNSFCFPTSSKPGAAIMLWLLIIHCFQCHISNCPVTAWLGCFLSPPLIMVMLSSQHVALQITTTKTQKSRYSSVTADSEVTAERLVVVFFFAVLPVSH